MDDLVPAIFMEIGEEKKKWINHLSFFSIFFLQFHWFESCPPWFGWPPPSRCAAGLASHAEKCGSRGKQLIRVPGPNLVLCFCLTLVVILHSRFIYVLHRGFCTSIQMRLFLIVCQFPISSVTTSEYCALRPESRESRRSRSRSRKRRRWAPRWARRPKGFTCLEIERKSDPRLKKKEEKPWFLEFLGLPQMLPVFAFCGFETQSGVWTLSTQPTASKSWSAHVSTREGAEKMRCQTILRFDSNPN